MEREFIRSVPILRMFDVGKTREFYCDYLGFSLDWEHRFDARLPLYMQVSRGAVAIHLTEHHGDATPGSAVRIEVRPIQAFHSELVTRVYAFARPQLEKKPWGDREMIVTDPAGNRIVFFEPPPPPEPVMGVS